VPSSHFRTKYLVFPQPTYRIWVASLYWQLWRGAEYRNFQSIVAPRQCPALRHVGKNWGFHSLITVHQLCPPRDRTLRGGFPQIPVYCCGPISAQNRLVQNIGVEKPLYRMSSLYYLTEISGGGFPQLLGQCFRNICAQRSSVRKNMCCQSLLQNLSSVSFLKTISMQISASCRLLLPPCQCKGSDPYGSVGVATALLQNLSSVSFLTELSGGGFLQLPNYCLHTVNSRRSDPYRIIRVTTALLRKLSWVSYLTEADFRSFQSIVAVQSVASAQIPTEYLLLPQISYRF
jgi:hypothetical protein